MLLNVLASLPPNRKEFATELYHKYKRTVWLAARNRLGNPNWADEVVQDVYIKLFSQLDHIAEMEESGRKAYIMTTTRNSARTFYHKEGKHNHADIENFYNQIKTAQPSVDDLVIKEEKRRKVEDEISTLKESERDIIVMRVNNGMSFREIGEALHISESNARVRFFRALGHVRDKINIEWGGKDE